MPYRCLMKERYVWPMAMNCTPCMTHLVTTRILHNVNLCRDGRVLLWRWHACGQPIYGMQVVNPSQRVPMAIQSAAFARRPLPGRLGTRLPPCARVAVRHLRCITMIVTRVSTSMDAVVGARSQIMQILLQMVTVQSL